MKPYAKFSAMMIVSFILMYAIMFVNVAQFDHIYLSTTRTYMTLLMVTPMAISMLLFMWGMYQKTHINYSIVVGAIVVFFLSLYGLRTQEPIGDIQWMKAMIPHHSSAILTSSNADFDDPEVQKLAQDIVQAQEEEIARMKSMLDRLENK